MSAVALAAVVNGTHVQMINDAQVAEDQTIVNQIAIDNAAQLATAQATVDEWRRWHPNEPDPWS